MTIDHVRDLVQVTLINDPEDPRVYTSVEALGSKRTAVVVSAAFAFAVLEKWPNGAGLETIRNYVRAARDKVSSENKPKQLVSEALIRSILSEEELAKELPNDEILRGQIWLTYELAHDLYKDDSARNRFVDEAVKIANQWLEGTS